MKNEIKEQILKVLKSVGRMSLLSLADHPDLKELANGKRTYGTELNGQKTNMVYLLNTNDAFVKAICELIDEKQVCLQRVNVVANIIDGSCYDLPIAEDIRVYEEEHWIPVDVVLI